MNTLIIATEFEKLASLGLIANGLSAAKNFLSNSATIGKAGNIFRNALATGWHGNKDLPGGINRWYGKTNIGKLPIYYPGAKTMTSLFTAMQLPDALAKEDPTGQGRSRAERLAVLGAGQIGNLAGGSLINKNLGSTMNSIAPMVTGMAGQYLAEGAASIPFKAFRAKKPKIELQSPTQNLQLTS